MASRKGGIMGFRENLQHLRATRSMTQEELAMLIGVSRQAVSKWEAERAYPEMDKLQKLCTLFDCTLDELVTGDLTERPAETALALREDAPAADIFSYDRLMVHRALMTSAGVGIIGLGSAAGLGTGSERYLLLFGLAGTTAGLALLAAAALQYAAFAKRHPFVEDFYVEADRARARSLQRTGVVAILVAALLGVAAYFVESGPLQHVAGGVGSLVAAVSVGAWALVLCRMLAKRMDVEGYNRRWAGKADDADEGVVEEEESAVESEPLPAAVAALPVARRRSRFERVAAGVLALAVASAAGLLALLAFRPPLSWYAWIVLVLVCVAAWIAVRAAREVRPA